ncbi:MAG TPA: hypothetical protein VJY47_02180 [Candidatus Dojkabacteria bacterium]|nr:hypothetical protein [Candidatus Dojkabacteria bacterium]
MNTKKTYTAQALAIVMIILVVASIIGFSVFSRLMTQKKAALQERESSEALEVADIILTNFLLSEPEEWEEKIAQDFLYKEKYDGGHIDPEGPAIEGEEGDMSIQGDMGMQIEQFGEEDSSSNAITKLTRALNHELDLQNLDICPLSNYNNEYTLKLSKTNEDTEFVLRPGETFVFPIGGRSLGNSCSINISFPNTGYKHGGFTINKIYIKEGKIQEYDYADTINYCFSNDGTGCNNPNFVAPAGGWDYFKSDTTLTIPVPFKGDLFERIQLTAIGEELTFKFSMPSDYCTESIQLWQLRASATCNGTYRAKEVIVPDVGWSYSIFNYVIFNGEGNMTSGEQ